MWKPEHVPVGGPVCETCGLHVSRHRQRRARVPRPDTRARRDIQRIIGIDGEGVGRKPHRYVYLAAVDETGEGQAISDPTRLSTWDCLDFLCDLPAHSLIVGFSFVYDLTMMLADMPDKALFMLFHEETRQRLVDGKVFYRPIRWNGFRINYMNRRFTVGRVESKRSTTVWDIFRFFQCSFVNALIQWKVAPQTELDAIAAMKSSRSDFENVNREEIHGYCQKECFYLSKLTRALIDAHEDAGLGLRSYYGAGSTASVFLKKVGIADKRGQIPEEMRMPVASAFFGGRFENSVVGPIDSTVWDYDISSAYPYQTFFLPCLSCGHWVHVEHHGSNALRRRRDGIRLVHWRAPSFRGDSRSWGPLPIRQRDGTIVFPLAGAGGWCWGDEFEAAQELNPALQCVEEWVYETECSHQPFEDVPQYYRQRVALGKDSRGIVLKLGINSIYGKLAQSKGVNPPFQSWVWAGLITSNTRGQLLRAIMASGDPAKVLMLATDGVWTSDKLSLPRPRDTGTFDVRNEKGELKPLGGWEEKDFPQGVFAVRPGIYFPLNPTDDDLEKVRGRGLGRKALYEHWQHIVDAYRKGEPKVRIDGMQRFIGAKSGILQSLRGVTRRDCFGEWIAHTVDVSFSPRPKREGINADGTLKAIDYVAEESVPYDAATISVEALLIKLAEQIAEEQPDADIEDLQ